VAQDIGSKKTASDVRNMGQTMRASSKRTKGVHGELLIDVPRRPLIDFCPSCLYGQKSQQAFQQYNFKKPNSLLIP
jgi:hypothetical protein